MCLFKGYLFRIHFLYLQYTYILSSCHATDPAGELTQCLSRFRSFLPSRLSMLGPCAATQSVMLCPSRHSPGIRLWFSSSLFNRLFCSWGYRILIRLCRQMQAMVVRMTWKRLARMPKAFSTTLRALTGGSWISAHRGPNPWCGMVSARTSGDQRHHHLQRQKLHKL